MVNRKLICALAAFSVSFIAAPRVFAQSVLEQMQSEVSAIAIKTKSAVVTISDNHGTALQVTRAPEKPTEVKKRAAEKNAAVALAIQYSNLDREETGARAELKELQKKYADTHPLVLAKKEEIRDLQKRMTETKTKLDALKDAAPNVTQLLYYQVSRSSATKTGSGFSIGNGYIVTTADVLDGMTEPVVTTDSGIQVRAKIVGVDKDMNVGLVRLLAKVDLPALTLGDSAKVAVGHFAISVGQQSGQANSVALMLVGGLRTEGVSAGGHFYSNLIQIAGTVGAGISGAPLVNVRGEVIGVMAGVPATPPISNPLGLASGLDYENGVPAPVIWQAPGINPYIVTPGLPEGEHLDTLPKIENPDRNSVPALGKIPLITPLFTNERVDYSKILNWNNLTATGRDAAPVTSAGFAVPINALKPVLDELKSGKVIGRGWIGISPNDAVTTTEKAGVIYANHYVTAEGVYPDSPAFLAGIMPGDVLLRLDNAPVRTATDVREASQRLRPGDKLKIAYRRAALPAHEVTLTITARPAVFKTPLTLPAK